MNARFMTAEYNAEMENLEGAAEAIVEASEGYAVPASARPSASPRPAPAMAGSGHFLVNLFSNAGLFGFNLLVGLWYTPYLIHHLGTGVYGIIPLVMQITGYMTIVTATLNTATGRYITIALEQNDDEEANRYFNTSFFGSMLLVLLLIPLTVWATVDLGSVINLPPGQETQARWLFVCTVAGFFMGVLQSPFGVSCFCRNRFDLENTITLIQSAARIGFVVLLFWLLSPQLWLVGVAAVGAMCFGWGWSIRLWRRLTPMLSISLAHFSVRVLGHLFSTGGWIAINLVGALLYTGIDLLVVNRMFGPTSGGRYAAVLQWSMLLRATAGIVGGLFCPTMLYYYAQHDIDSISRYGRQAVKLTGLLIALPIGLICGLSAPLLQTWLGPTFVDLEWLMSLMTIHLAVNLAIFPLLSVQVTTNRVRTPAIVTLVMGACNLGLAILLAGPAGWGLYGIAAAGAIALTAKNLLFTPLYAAHVLNRRWNTFLREIVPIALATLGLAGIGKLLAVTWDVSGWPRLVSCGAAMFLVYAGVGYWALLSRDERALAWSLLPKLRPTGKNG